MNQTQNNKSVVTGAFSLLGRYMAEILIEQGCQIKTLTNRPQGNLFKGYSFEQSPYCFDDFNRLVSFLRGADVFYNTYWVRLNTRHYNYQEAIRRSEFLFKAALAAGIKKFVHISVLHSEHTSLEYYRSKFEVEQILKQSGLSYIIVKPSLFFAKEDILINNIVWFLRKFPAFFLFGDGQYRCQPVFVGDVARVAIESSGEPGNKVIELVGPEVFVYRDMIRLIIKTLNKKMLLLKMPSAASLAILKVFELFTRDVVLNRDEIEYMTSEMLYADIPSLAKTDFSTWIVDNIKELGVSYHNDMRRRQPPLTPF